MTTLVSNAITAGVGGGLYGVDQPTLRQQMAVFLLKGRHGICYVPPPCTGIFDDVTCTPGSGFGDWIEALAGENITGGCGGNNYCPLNPVRRDQMAVFLLKAEHGPNYVPPPCVGHLPGRPLRLARSRPGSSSSPSRPSRAGAAAATTARSIRTPGGRWRSSWSRPSSSSERHPRGAAARIFAPQSTAFSSA